MRSLCALASATLLVAAGCSLDRTGLGGTDAGTGPSCMARGEICNDADDDCDGTVDEDFELDTDLANCGSCGIACPLDPGNGSPRCAAGRCILTCDPGFADCNDDLRDGCEAVLGDPAHCGACGTTCSAPTPLCQRNSDDTYTCVADCAAGLTQCGVSCVDTDTDLLHCARCNNPCAMVPNSRPTCSGGTCGFVCDGTFEDCNGMDADGCEVDTQTDASHCNGCGRACALARATASCVAGVCRISSCDSGRENCNGMDADGCETDLATDAMSCGRCGNVCSLPNAVAACMGGACRIASCTPGFEDCNGMDADGCETAVATDLANCGGCGNACSLPNTTAHSCTGGICGITTCASGYEDCNGTGADGCEVQTETDPTRCGGCTNTCSLPATATHACSGGTCRVATCDPGFDDCNSTDSDGCEADLTSTATCGSCATACGPGQSCTGGTCMGCRAGCTCVDTDCRRGSNACNCNSGCTCDFQCNRNCIVNCSGTCTTTTSGSGLDIDYTCNSGATCTFGARNASNATIICNAGSTCVIDCTNASNCYMVRCQGSGADCQLDCTGASNCDFATCSGTQRSCPGNIEVCNPTGTCP